MPLPLALRLQRCCKAEKTHKKPDVTDIRLFCAKVVRALQMWREIMQQVGNYCRSVSGQNSASSVQPSAWQMQMHRRIVGL